MPCCSTLTVATTTSAEVQRQATELLIEEAERDEGNLHRVKKLVKAGANVNECLPRDEKTCIFLEFVWKGHLDCFEACLTSRHPVDFTDVSLEWEMLNENGVRQVFRPSVLFFLLLGRSDAEAEVIFKAIVKRLRKKVPGDKVEWESGYRLNQEFNFLSHATDSQQLHVVWPIVKVLPHFANKTEKIPIYTSVAESDWNQLTDKDQARFQLLQGFGDLPTKELHKLCFIHPTDVAAVRRLVLAGARVLSSDPFIFSPLTVFVMNGVADGVAACMETPHPIDFTLWKNGKNIWISICMYAHNEEVAAAMLRPIVKRVAENRPGDTINWYQEDHLGHDFFAHAAEYDLLHVVWPIVKELPHFRNKKEPIVLTTKVTLEDWDQLSEEDRKRFDPQDGFVSTHFRIRGDRVLFTLGKRYVERTPEVLWQRLRELGRGSFGVVYLGQLKNGELVAVKVAHLNKREDSLGSSEKRRSMVIEEMEIMAHLHHRNVVTFYGAKSVPGVSLEGEEEERVQIFMEYCPGLEGYPGSLSSLLKLRPEMFTMPVVRSYAKQILEGLAYLHRVKVIHRDLKPENVLLTSDGTLKLTDFGWSKTGVDGDSRFSTLAGTPMFIAPEVLNAKNGNAEYGPAVDIWSFGCTVIALLGRKPWSDDLSEVQLMWKIAFSNELPSGIPKPCPKDLHDFLTKCFNRDASKRWTAEQLLQHRWMTCAESELVEAGGESHFSAR